jgi:hypothetical protein
MENLALETALTEEEAKTAVRLTLKKALKLYFKSDLAPAEVMNFNSCKTHWRKRTGNQKYSEYQIAGVVCKK